MHGGKHAGRAFKAQNDTELSFGKGDRLEVLDIPSSDPEWFKVRQLKDYVASMTSIIT